MNYSKLIKAVEESPLRKADIIEKSGISKGTLENALKGMDIKVTTLEALAKVLGVNVSFFFDEQTTEIKYNERSFNNNADESVKNLTSVINKQQEVIGKLEDRIAQLTDKLLGI